MIYRSDWSGERKLVHNTRVFRCQDVVELQTST